MGRLLTFMARIRKDNNIKNGVVTRGVGVDEHTALLLDVKTGDVQTVGVGTAYVCSTDHAAEICADSVPLTFHGIDMFIFNAFFAVVVNFFVTQTSHVFALAA
jgi:cyanophycinase-like exopeptidase